MDDSRSIDARSAEKRLRLEHGLELGVVMLHVDARRPGVAVPARFRDDFHLRLNVSLRFDPPDLTVGDWGVRETLSFGGSRFPVAVPWSAIFAITGMQREDQAFLFPEDMPEELLEAAARQFGLSGDEMALLRTERDMDRRELTEGQPVPTSPEAPAPVPDASRAAPPGMLRLVTEEKASDEEPPDGDDGASPQRRKCHLKLVK